MISARSPRQARRKNCVVLKHQGMRQGFERDLPPGFDVAGVAAQGARIHHVLGVEVTGEFRRQRLAAIHSVDSLGWYACTGELILNGVATGHFLIKIEVEGPDCALGGANHRSALPGDRAHPPGLEAIAFHTLTISLAGASMRRMPSALNFRMGSRTLKVPASQSITDTPVISERVGAPADADSACAFPISRAMQFSQCASAVVGESKRSGATRRRTNIATVPRSPRRLYLVTI